ncbi:hypothetical protein ACQY0O_006280 [Thecaphora frezii]
MATNRLRRRLQEADSTTLAKLTENFCKIGTPLPALDAQKRDPNDYKPIWQQEARDEQGRRRFHGAFTGGFSAGYFNTVGSKEGWTPSSFRSSRADKAKGQNQNPAIKSRPEDFMDEEDLADARETRQIQASRAYADSSAGPSGSDPLLGLFGNNGEDAERTLATAALEELIRPASTSIGVQLLKRMGWKEGHGLGPRVTYSKRKRLLQLQNIGTAAALDSAAANEDENDDEKDRHLFPPPNTKLMHLENKSDSKGLGWKHSSSLDELLVQARASRRDAEQGSVQRTRPMAIVDLDSDGEADVFAEEADIQQSTLIHSRHGPAAVSRGRNQPLARIKKASGTAGIDKWRDGSKVIDGFKVASSAVPPDPHFAAPVVPKDWKPNPQALWDRHAPATKPRAAATGAAIPASRELDPTTRGSLLGEARMPGPPPLLSDFLSAKAQERLAAAAGAALPRETTTTTPTPLKPLEIPATDPATARAALLGFMPFGSDLPKQGRYRAYLRSQADPASSAESPDISAEIGRCTQQELTEFAQSAAIFRPMSTTMANRFTSASSTAAAQEIASPAPGLRQPQRRPAADQEAKNAAEEEKREALAEQLTPAQEAARAGMFGRLTRSVKPWYPARLLCKRFNVPDPHPDRSEDADPASHGSLPTAATSDPFYGATSHDGRYHADMRANELWETNKQQIQQLADSKAWERSVAPSQRSAPPIGGAGQVQKQTLETLGLGDDERQGKDTMSYVKPSVDIFKAIFASDEEESEDNDDVVGGSGSGVASISVGIGTSMGRNESKREATSIGDPMTMFRPSFVPRAKRKANDAEPDRATVEMAPPPTAAGAGAIRKVEKKQKKEKPKPKGMLTFDLDHDEADSVANFTSVRRKANQSQSQSHTKAQASTDGEKAQTTRIGDASGAPPPAPRPAGPRTNRPRASDLF